MLTYCKIKDKMTKKVKKLPTIKFKRHWWKGL